MFRSLSLLWSSAASQKVMCILSQESAGPTHAGTKTCSERRLQAEVLCQQLHLLTARGNLILLIFLYILYSCEVLYSNYLFIIVITQL